MIDYTVEPESNLVVTHIPMDASLEAFSCLLDRLASDPAAIGHNRIFVCVQSTDSRISGTEIKALAAHAADLSGKGDFLTAIVASAEVDYGLARMFATRRSRPNGMLNIFRSIEDARAWLRAESD